MPKRYTFVLNFGYVESQEMSYMPWTSQLVFKDAKDALVHLAYFLKDNFVAGSPGRKLKKCCQTAKANATQMTALVGGAGFCSKCGASLAAPDFDGEKFEQWLRQLAHSSNDDISHYIEDIHDKTQHWEPGLLEGAVNPRYVYNAEWVLSAAVGSPHQKDRTLEVICKERTKSRKDAFSYY